MSTQTHKKTEFLGMPYGTARQQLGKMVLFNLLIKQESNICYRCKLMIENVEDLTFDHKKPWLYESKELFWDLNNVSFSHFSCNSRATRYNPVSGMKQRKIGPEGTAWCSKHKEFISTEKFSKGSRWDGLRETCNDCRSYRYKKGLGR